MFGWTALVLLLSLIISASNGHEQLDGIPLSDDYIPYTFLGKKSGKGFGAQSIASIDKKAAASAWCPERDQMVDYLTGKAPIPPEMVYSPLLESFVTRIISPAPVFKGTDNVVVGLKEYIEMACAHIGDPVRTNASIAVSYFAASAIMLHGTMSQLRKCFGDIGLASFVLRVCHWHDGVVVHPELQQVLELESASQKVSDDRFSHIVAVVAPTTPSEGALCPTRNIKHVAELYNDKYQVKRWTGYSFAPHSLLEETPDDYIRHFICEDEINATTSRCNLSALLQFILHQVRAEEGLINIEARKTVRIHNKFSRGILESGAQFQEPFGKGLGLTGEGYVVGVADTGVDYDHCFFHDPNVEVPLNKQNKNHRKIIRYMTIGNNQGDFLPGHGTHVAGSIAGAPYDPQSEYADFHGVLPKAKLVVWDQSAGSGEGLRGVNNFNDLFGISYNDGARVHSNSWGSAGSSYSSEAVSVDTYTRQNRHLLPIFAAGNDADSKCGAFEKNLYCDRRTIISPCIAKNVLCVGASMGSQDSWEYAKLGNYFMRIPGLSTKSYTVLKGNFGPTNVSLLTSVDLILSSPLDGCSPLQNVNLVRGKIVVFSRGVCVFTQKILAAQNAGAAGALIVNNVNGDAIIMGCDQFGDCGVKIPNFMIDKISGGHIVDYLKNNSNSPRASIQSSTERDPHKGEDNLSEFSSHGPTSDNRIKPEIVAVGELVVSAFSDANLNSFNCDIWATQGTSMATPLSSGLATMLLQYFEKGIHIDGSLNNSQRGMRDITSSFLKAALIHAATPLTGVFDRNSRGDWRQLGRTPSSEQGFGKPLLNRSFPTSLNSPIQVFVEDSAKVINGASIEYCIHYNGLADGFAATLTWIDPPNRAGAAYTLINNLDLVVIPPDGSVAFHGNMDPSSNRDDIRTAGATAGRDVLNNVEKVRLPNAPAGIYRVRVEGTNVASGTQDFSLIVSGKNAAECEPFCPNVHQCLHGTCSNGMCECSAGWVGPRCDAAIFSAPRHVNGTLSVVLEPMQWAYFNIPAESVTQEHIIAITSLTSDGELDYMLCDTAGNSGPTTPSGCIQKDNACQTCGNDGPPAKQSPLIATYTPNANRVLSITAQCCYQAIAEIKYTNSIPAASPHLIGVQSATIATGAPMYSVTFLAHGIDLLGPSASLWLHSSRWGADMGRLTRHECAISSRTHDAITCSTQTLPCQDRLNMTEEYFSVVLTEGSRVIDAPHPSALHVRCSHFESQQSGLKTSVPMISTTQPLLQRLPSVHGFVTAAGNAHSIVIPRADAGSDKKFLVSGSALKVPTEAGYIELLLKMRQVTASAEYSNVEYSEAQEVRALLSATARDDQAAFTLPSEVMALASRCSNNFGNCGLVEITISAQLLPGITGFTGTTAQLITSANLTLFLQMDARIEAINLQKTQSDETEDLPYFQTQIIPVTDIAQYSDPTYGYDRETSERWIYLQGRFLSGNPQTSATFGSLLQSAVVIPPTSSRLFVRLVVPAEGAMSEQIVYCGILNALSDEVLECKVLLYTINIRPSSVSTRLVIQAAFPGQEVTSQNRVRLLLSPTGAVLGLADSFGTMVAQPAVSSSSTLTIAGVALTSDRIDLLLVKATLISADPTVSPDPIVLPILHATPTMLVVRFESVTARVGMYFLQVSLTTKLRIDIGQSLSFTYKGQNAGSYLTGLTSGGEINVHELTYTKLSTRDKPLTLTLNGANLDMIAGDIHAIRLTSKVESVTTQELCHMDRSQISPATLLCYISPFARGRYRVEVLVGRFAVPLSSRGASLYVAINDRSTTLPPYSTAFTFDPVLLVGASVSVSVSGSLNGTWAADRVNVGLIVSATPCYAPSIIGSSTTILDGDDVVGFTLQTYAGSTGIAHVCLKNGAAQCGPDFSFVFYTRVSIDVITLSPTIQGQLKVTNRNPFTLDGSLKLVSSSVGEFVNNVYVYVDLIESGKQCSNTATAEGITSVIARWEESEEWEEGSYLTSTLQAQATSQAITNKDNAMVCLAASTNVNDAYIKSERFVAIMPLDCLVSNQCGAAGACANGGACQCDQWFGGPQCSFMCESSLDGRTCNGYQCFYNGLCNCHLARSVDEEGNEYFFRGPACQVPTQLVSIDEAPQQSGQAAFQHAPTYYPASDRVSVPKATPIILALGGRGMDIINSMGAAEQARQGVLLDVVLVVPEGVAYVSARLHFNDSRLLQPIGAVHQIVAASSDLEINNRHFVLMSFPLTGARPLLSSPGLVRGCFLVVEAAATEVQQVQWSHVSIGLSLRYSKALPASVHLLSRQEVLLSDDTQTITLNRYDISLFATTFSLFGTFLSFSVGLATGMIVLKRKRMLSAQGPKLLYRKLGGSDRYMPGEDQEMGTVGR